LEDDLHLVIPAQVVKNKVSSNAPRFWRWQAMQCWLTAATDKEEINVAQVGILGPEREYRTHVRINSVNQTGEDGMLFQTSGMEFARAEQDATNRLKKVYQLAMVAKSEANFSEGLGAVGGERRIASWQKSQQKFPACPDTIKQAIVAKKHCRLILATPAIFEKGYLPTHLEQAFGVKATVKGVACSRYQTISGWDYEKPGPKPTRRLVPAGSVYFLQLEGSNIEIEKFIDAVWLNPVSDAEQDRLDGFGLALLGTWGGKLREVKS
jgi:CRISPR-associated protein Cmr3